MLHDTPLRNHHQAYADRIAGATASAASSYQVDRPGAADGTVSTPEVEYIAFGSADDDAPRYALCATLGSVELEYAAIRRGAGVLDLPHRATLRVTGTDRRAFLNRMLTQELAPLEPGLSASSFWLNRTGRIDADLVVVESENETLLLLDRHQAHAAATSLASFIIMEEVLIENVSEAWHHLALHGPSALQVLAHASGDDEVHIADQACGAIALDGVSCTVVRRDTCATVGVDILVPRDAIETVWAALVSADDTVADGRRRVRPIGWYAFNIARIEAGTPLFNVDFGTSSLPHETGIVEQRVSFTKGCYLGQEVVARMHSRGRSKQIIVAYRMERHDAMPVAGTQVYADDDETLATPSGVVTSSSVSPMLGAASIGFATVRTTIAKGDTALRMNIDGAPERAIVQPTLTFLHGNDT